MSAAKKLGSLESFKRLILKKWANKVHLREIDPNQSGQFDSKVIALANSLSPEEVLRLVLNQGLSHIVQVSDEAVALEQELNSSALMINDASLFLTHPISGILDPGKAGFKREKELTLLSLGFSKASEKHSVLDQISVKVKDIAKSQSLVNEVLGVADELVTNAIFNAPFVDKANSTSGIGRKAPDVQMGPGLEGRIFLGHEGQRLVVGAHDPYGTLNLNRLFQRILDCYLGGVADNINMGSGGAGIGSFMVFNACSSFYAAVKDGNLTLICCIIPIGMSGRKRATLPKNLHYYHSEDEE